MNSQVSFGEINQARQTEQTLRTVLRETLKAKRAEVREIKGQLNEMREEDRAGMIAKAKADGATQHGSYAVKVNGKRATIIPADPKLPISKVEARFLTAILSTLS